MKLALGGALGRMGRANLRVALATEGVEICGAWERPGILEKGRDLGELNGLLKLGVTLADNPADALTYADVAIDFSTPDSTMATLKAAATRRLPLVIGTTGLNAAETAALADYAQTAPLIHSSNFSIGVNLLWKLAEDAARATGEDYDIEIVDLHHAAKKDAPSGTALTLAERLAQARGGKLDALAVYGRRTRDGSRVAGEIGIHALRAGDVVGDHTVLFAGPHERLELVHRSHSRENFARGAMRAALWLAAEARKPGMYDMRQVLGLE